MSIKNISTKHWLRPKWDCYLCNGACSVTKEKVAKTMKDVTCLNCLKQLEKGRR